MADPKVYFRGNGKHAVRAYNGGLRVQPLVRNSEGKAPLKAEKLLSLERPKLELEQIYSLLGIDTLLSMPEYIVLCKM